MSVRQYDGVFSIRLVERNLIVRARRQIGLIQQAIYCFTQAIKADKEDVDTMWDRAVLLKLSDAKSMVSLGARGAFVRWP